MAYRFNPFTSQLDFYQEDTQFVSSGGIANLTSGQQDLIREGSIVTTTDGRRWAYSGTGSKTLEASYVELADITPEWSVIANKPSIPTAAPAAGQIMAGNAGGTAFATVSVSGDATLAATGALTIANNAVTNAKLAAAASGTLKGRTASGTGDVSDLTASDVRALLNVADGAEANVQANWTESNAALDSFIQNKPTLGGAALLNVGTTTGTVAAGDDSRLSDARTPTAHTHGNISNTGTIGSTAGLPVVTTTSGALATLPLGTAGQALVVNSGATALEFATPVGGVTSVTGTSPIASSGGTTPAISIADAAADGTTKGAAAFNASDFNSASGVISLDYTNGQSASASNKGFLTSADWTTFNNKTGGSVGAVDNAVLRADVGTGIVQNSNIVIDDVATATQDNVAIVNASSATDSALVLTPKGTGAFILGPKPDGTATGGNARGARAVDLQLERTANTQVASGARAFIGGGQNNTVSAGGGVICGGTGNTCSTAGGNSENFVGGGNGNSASGANNAVCVGGTSNTASGERSFVGGGNSNSATAWSAAVCGGRGASAQGTGSFVGGGYVSLASGNGAVVGGGGLLVGGSSAGGGNTASGTSTGILGGQRALADRYAMQAHGAGEFSAQGDAQRARFVLRNKTTTNSAVELFLDGSSTRLTIPSAKSVGGTIQICGTTSGGETANLYIRQFLIRNRGGTTALIGSIQTVGTDIEGIAAADVTLSADDTNDALKVEVTGYTPVTGCTAAASTDVISKNAHGFSNNDDIVFTSLTGGAGLTANTVTYWVINANADDFQVSATRGGAAVNITTNYTDMTATRVIRWVANVDCTEIGHGT